MKRWKAAKRFKSYVKSAEDKHSVIVVIPTHLARLICNALTGDIK